jgi:hypothetical protein
MSAAWQGTSTEADTAPEGGDSIMNLRDLVLLIAQKSCVITPPLQPKGSVRARDGLIRFIYLTGVPLKSNHLEALASRETVFS